METASWKKSFFQNKKLLSLIVALAMILSAVPVWAIPNEIWEPMVPVTTSVKLRVERVQPSSGSYSPLLSNQSVAVSGLAIDGSTIGYNGSIYSGVEGGGQTGPSPLSAIVNKATAAGASASNSSTSYNDTTKQAYVSQFAGLAAAAPGLPNSGWMYFVNDKYSNKAINNHVLSANDRVSFFYVNDYRTNIYATLITEDTNPTDPSADASPREYQFPLSLSNNGQIETSTSAIPGETLFFKVRGTSLNFYNLFERPEEAVSITVSLLSRQDIPSTGEVPMDRMGQGPLDTQEPQLQERETPVTTASALANREEGLLALRSLPTNTQTTRFDRVPITIPANAVVGSIYRIKASKAGMVNAYFDVQVVAAPSSAALTTFNSLKNSATNLINSNNYISGSTTYLTAARNHANSLGNNPSVVNALSAINYLKAAINDAVNKADVNTYELGCQKGSNNSFNDYVELTPAFAIDNASHTYAASIGGNTQFKVKLDPVNDQATVNPLPNAQWEVIFSNLQPGLNTRTITISGTNSPASTKTYTFNITKPDSAPGSPDHAYYLPAPGQFVNQMGGGWGDILSNGLNKIVKDLGGVSLGRFGGYVLAEYTDGIPNDPTNRYGIDFIVYGNAFSGWAEPGCIEVANNLNGPWYRIAGSEFYKSVATINDPIAPSSSSMLYNSSGSWTLTNPSETGTFPAANYPTAGNYNVAVTLPPNATYNATSMTYGGMLLSDNLEFPFGYCDVHPNGSGDKQEQVNPYLYGTAGATVKGDPIDISWAVDQDGKPANLTSVKYIKIHTGVNKVQPPFGEISTEVTAIKKASLKNDTAQQTAPPTLYADDEEIDTIENMITLNEDGVPILSLSTLLDNHEAFSFRELSGGTNTFVNGVRDGTVSRSMITELQSVRVHIITQRGNRTPYIKVFYLVR